MFDFCEACTHPDDKARWATRKAAVRCNLIGDFSVDLCSECRNAWHEFVLPKQEYKNLLSNRISRNQVEVESYSAPRSQELSDRLLRQIESIDRRDVEIHEALYELGKKWVSDRAAASKPSRSEAETMP